MKSPFLFPPFLPQVWHEQQQLLIQWCAAGKTVVCVTGKGGAGKTTFMQCFLEAEWGYAVQYLDARQNLKAQEQRKITDAVSGVSTIVCVDNADALSTADLVALLQTAGSGVHLIFFGLPGLEQRLPSETCFLALACFSGQDMRQFTKKVLAANGLSPRWMGDSQLDQLYYRSQGVPKQLCAELHQLLHQPLQEKRRSVSMTRLGYAGGALGVGLLSLSFFYGGASSVPNVPVASEVIPLAPLVVENVPVMLEGLDNMPLPGVVRESVVAKTQPEDEHVAQ